MTREPWNVGLPWQMPRSATMYLPSSTRVRAGVLALVFIAHRIAEPTKGGNGASSREGDDVFRMHGLLPVVCRQAAMLTTLATGCGAMAKYRSASADDTTAR